MNAELLQKLREIGQSFWLDNLSRNLINSGELKRLIEEDGITGITSNPTIFQKAISGSTDYDESLQTMLEKKIRDGKELFLGLAIEDISRAAERLWPIYQKSGGLDGFVSIEVSPDLAYDTPQTIAEARRLFSALGKKNILVKVPGTKQGIPAIEQLTAEGMNVNVTLLFSVRRYEEIAEAYIRGLEKRAGQGKPINQIFSVASFFVSRVDTMVDRLLEERLTSAPSVKVEGKIKSLLGRAAVANAKLAYAKYKEIFWGKRFQALTGAHVQKILWGSSGTKNPSYSDIRYVEELMGPDSINTMPEATLKAFMDHGRPAITVYTKPGESQKLFSELQEMGVDIGKVADQLEIDGVKLFADSFRLLLREIAQKRETLLPKKL